LERHADLLLMDDKKARNEAAELRLQCAYTTDVLRLGEQRGVIASAAEIVEGLRSARIYLPFDTGQWQD
jgi:predicted nucleic acid-binding protein